MAFFRPPSRSLDHRSPITVRRREVLEGLAAFGAGAALISTGCDLVGVRGSGELSNTERTIGAFTALEARGMVDVKLSVGGGPSLKLSGDKNLLPLLVSEVVDGTLFLYPKGTIRVRKPMVATLQVPQAPSSITLRSHARVVGANIDTDELVLDLEGATNIGLRGSANKLDIQATGAARVAAQTLSSEAVIVKARGAAQIEVMATKTLTVDLAGAARVMYEGRATVASTLADGASVTRGRAMRGRPAGRPRLPFPPPSKN